MLTSITIQNFAIIPDAAMALGEGLSVLTGETGAGKSIVVDALDVIAGGRAGRESVRTGAGHAQIEARFSGTPRAVAFLREKGFETAGGGIVVLRSIDSAGKSRATINGKTAGLAVIRELAPRLMDICGQNDSAALGDHDFYLSTIDRFGGEDPRITSFKKSLAEVRESIALYRKMRADLDERAQRIDFLRFQHRELTEAALRPGEDASLDAELTKAKSIGRIRSAAAHGLDVLIDGEQSVSAAVSGLSKEIALLIDVDPDFAGLLDKLAAIGTLVEDAAHDLRKADCAPEAGDEAIDAVIGRIDLLTKLKKKYRMTVDELMAYRDTTGTEIDRLERVESDIADIERRIVTRTVALLGESAKAFAVRSKRAREFEKFLVGELITLAMPKARFKVELSADDPSAPVDVSTAIEAVDVIAGAQEVDFLFSANPGERLLPLARVASGGELSRVMLALKALAVGDAEERLIVFDEIDAGIGGLVANEVARKLSTISRRAQVIAVTHLAQIASLADTHFVVAKDVSGERAVVTLARLAKKTERISEISRMLGGADEERKALASKMVTAAGK